MFFHGGNDSRLAGGLLEAAAIATGVRLICPERPGFGRSTYQPGRDLLDWSSDVEQLANRLDLGRFGLVGHSGGGPHALACAAALPQRITGVATVSSVAPPPATNRGLHPMFRVVNAFMNHPHLYRTVARSQLRQMSKHPDRWLGAWAKMQPADGAMFREQPHIASHGPRRNDRGRTSRPSWPRSRGVALPPRLGLRTGGDPDHDGGMARSQRPSGDPSVGSLPGRQHPVCLVDAGRGGGPLLDTRRQCRRRSSPSSQR